MPATDMTLDVDGREDNDPDARNPASDGSISQLVDGSEGWWVADDY
jgi:hypothetical protein